MQLDPKKNNKNKNKFYDQTMSYVLLFTLVVGMSFLNDAKRNLCA